MEKIIAVVVMIAIVIGLIATAVLPMVNQMNEQGDQANNQLATLTATMSGDVYTGSTVKAEIKSNLTKFNLAAEKLTTITVTAATGSSFTSFSASTAADATTKVATIPDNAMFKRTTETYPSGAIKTITYTEQTR